MSFSERFGPRWETVIAPAIRSVQFNRVELEPCRVDARQVSDSILTEILGGISESRLVFADITSVGEASGGPVRNGNVMYEIGLAHATRLPEEVLLFRSDCDRLLFDVANIRVNDYDPDGSPIGARETVQRAIMNALSEVQLQKNVAVNRALQALDLPGLNVMARALEGLQHPETRTMGQVLSAGTTERSISRLLDLGLLRTEVSEIKAADLNAPNMNGMLRYRITPFGTAALNAYAQTSGLLVSNPCPI
jgi:hypothetical protein